MTRILAVDDNLINLKVIVASMKPGGYEVLTASSGKEALSVVDKNVPDLIILDLDMPEMDGFEVCRRLRNNPHTANTPIIILTAHNTLEEKVKGFEVGADDYMTKPFQPVELLARVKAFLRKAEAFHAVPVEMQGKIISVFSLRGGAGVSTVACNLACGLEMLWKKPVILVDMAFVLGQSALMLNVPMRNTWSDLVEVRPEEMEMDVLRKVILRHSSGVDLLAAPHTPTEGELITPETAAAVLNVLREQYEYIILDLPHDFSDTTLIGLEQSDEILMVITPDLASVRSIVGALDVFKKLQFSTQKVRVLMNTTFEKRGLARKDIENVIKIPIPHTIPFASETFVNGINMGVPPVIMEPAGAVSMFFEDISFTVAKEEHRKQKPEAPSDAWKRVVERIRKRKD